MIVNNLRPSTIEDPAWRTMTRHSARRRQLLEITNGRKSTPLFTIESLPVMPRECQYLLPEVTSVRLITPHNHYRGIIRRTHPRQNAQRQCHLPCLPPQGAISVISSTRAHAATEASANSGTCSLCSGHHPKVSCKAGNPPYRAQKSKGRQNHDLSQCKKWNNLLTCYA